MRNKWVGRLWRLWSVLYFLVVVYVVFFARRRPDATWKPHQYIIDWMPFRQKWHLYIQGHDLSGIYLDIFGNIIMFAPLPLFLFIVFGVRNYWILLLSAFLLSLGIETLQYISGVGFADIDDIIFNTLGGGLGIVIIDGIKNALHKGTIPGHVKQGGS